MLRNLKDQRAWTLPLLTSFVTRNITEGIESTKIVRGKQPLSRCYLGLSPTYNLPCCPCPLYSDELMCGCMHQLSLYL